MILEQSSWRQANCCGTHTLQGGGGWREGAGSGSLHAPTHESLYNMHQRRRPRKVKHSQPCLQGFFVLYYNVIN